MIMGRLLRSGAVVAMVLTFGACGAERPTRGSDPTDADAGALPVVVVDGEIQVGCGGPPGWSPSLMADGLPGVFTDAEMDAVFRELLADPALAPELELSFLSEGAEETEWRVLAREESTVTLGLGLWADDGPIDRADVMVLEREGGGWRLSGGGDCRLQPLLRPENTWVELSAPKGGIDRDGTSLTVGVNERECSSGRDPTPFLHEPSVVETETSVTVYWTSAPPAGGQNCLGNAPVERELTLQRPLGDRTLLDGSTYPPCTVR